jgi:hypothetical protein
MPFKNRIRLPFYITRPQFPSEQNIFRRADGTSKTLSAVVRKVYEGETNYLAEAIHERLKIALSHDDVTIEGQRYLGGVSPEGDYEISWSGFLDYPLAKAEFKVQVTPFNYSNDNCQTCDEATQLSLDDDTITGPYEVLEESQQYQYNVFENDSICCSPITAEIVTINSLYIASASIDATSGILTITIKDTVPSATLANLLTYRVTCPNGSYDDADVYGNVDGSEIACLAPGSLDAGTVTETSASPNWFDIPIPSPVSYNYQLYLSSDLFNPINTGNTPGISVLYDSLMPGTSYTFYVQSVCEGGGTSEFISIQFTTVGETSGGCGLYEVFIFGGPPFEYTQITHLNCNGVYVNAFVQNQSSSTICTMEESPGVPVDIIGADDIQYLGPC